MRPTSEYNRFRPFISGDASVLPDFSTIRSADSGPAAEVWRRTLSQIRTHFGRLVYVARLRDSATGQYLYRPLNDAFGPELAGRTLANSHHTVFSDWIASTLARQKCDLDQYLSESGEPPMPNAYRDLVPHGVHEVERQLYLTDLETLLALIRFERESSASVPTASPHPLPVR